MSKEKAISAALDLWESYGQLAVTCRNIGKVLGISGQRVHKIVGGDMAAFHVEVIGRAIESDRAAIVLQLQASGHPMAPPIMPKRLM